MTRKINRKILFPAMIHTILTVILLKKCLLPEKIDNIPGKCLIQEEKSDILIQLTLY